MTDTRLVDLIRLRIVDLRLDAAFALDMQEKAADLATFEQAVASYAEWERLRRSYEATIEELEGLLRKVGREDVILESVP